MENILTLLFERIEYVNIDEHNKYLIKNTIIVYVLTQRIFVYIMALCVYDVDLLQ